MLKAGVVRVLVASIHNRLVKHRHVMHTTNGLATVGNGCSAILACIIVPHVIF
jgi:hypothetical protein